MTPDLVTVRDQIAWSYANLARAHAALAAGREEYSRTDHIVRARLFKGLQSQRMSIRSLYFDERVKHLSERCCTYCGQTGSLTVDHLIPRVAGGGDDGANLVLCCRACNSSKGGRDLLAWYGRRAEFPPLLLLRRYLKLVAMWCEREELLDVGLQDITPSNLPFDIGALPVRFPPLRELRL